MTAAQPVRIALVDDHRMFLDGLTEVIQALDTRYACTAFSSPSEAIAAIDGGETFDLVIADLVMPEMNGVALVLALKARAGAAPVLVISGVDTFPPIEKILETGARGFISKAAPSQTLHAAIRTVLAGETFLTGDVWERLSAGEGTAHLPALAGGDAAGPLLGPRQVDVLRLLAEGCSNKKISEALGISENTVKTHVRAIFRQLNVTRRTACVNRARALGLVD